MKRPRSVLAAAVLGAAAALSAPRLSSGYSTLGISLNADRIGFQTNPSSFTDPASNDNAAPDASWPGAAGADLALRKAAAEWSSQLRAGTGAGDPLQPGGLGSGGSNFDFMSHGTTAATGGLTSAVIRAGGLLGVGMYAVAQTNPNGWSVVFDNSAVNGWDWQDGPGNETDSTNRVDIQGVATHELGHALGLGHSGVASATMAPFTPPQSTTSWRSIEPDDVAGLHAIYGAKLATKPVITGISGNVWIGSPITLTGAGFAATGNQVWFTKKTDGATTTQPMTAVKVTGLASAGGTSLTVVVPPGVAAGDVIVQRGGASADQTLKSAAFPFALTAPPPGPAAIAAFSPDPIPVAAQVTPVLTIFGTNLATATSVSVGTQTYGLGPLAVVNDNEARVTFLPPPKETGVVAVTVTNAFGVSAPAPLTLALSPIRMIFPSAPPQAGATVTLYLASPAPGSFPILAYSSCIGFASFPPLVTFLIGGCGDLQFLAMPPFDAAGITSTPVTIPATFHGTVQLQFADTDVGLSTIPFPTSPPVPFVVP